MQIRQVEYKLSKKTIIPAFVLILLIFAIASSVYFYTKYQKAQKMLTSTPLSAKEAQEEVKSLTEKVGKLVELPKDEIPTIITVKDVEQVKNIAFFANAKNGDKVLVYTNAKKAILYDPVLNKVIEMGPLLLPTPSNAASTPALQISPTVTPLSGVSDNSPINIVLYNGTTTTGLTYTAEKQLVAKLPNITIIGKDKAKKNDYVKTVVVNLTGKKSDQVSEISKILGGEITALPEGETAPVATIAGQTIDVLAILGQDFGKR